MQQSSTKFKGELMLMSNKHPSPDKNGDNNPNFYNLADAETDRNNQMLNQMKDYFDKNRTGNKNDDTMISEQNQSKEYLNGNNQRKIGVVNEQPGVAPNMSNSFALKNDKRLGASESSSPIKM